jgi:hypothetical protein
MTKNESTPDVTAEIVDTPKPENTPQQDAPIQEQKNVLLGTISYTNEDDYENFLSKMDLNQSLFVLIASANFGQSKGLYNLDESELVAKAIKTIKKNSATSEPTETNS